MGIFFDSTTSHAAVKRYFAGLGFLVAVLVVPMSSLAQDKMEKKGSEKQIARVFAGNGKPIDAGSENVSNKATASSSLIRPRTGPDAIRLGNPFGVEIIASKVWITSVDDHRVWSTDLTDKQIRLVVGNGKSGYSGDGGLAIDATMNWPHEVRVDNRGNLYIADTRNHVIRFVDAKTKRISTLAGDGTAGFAGDGKSQTDVRFNQPHSVVLDGNGGLLVADTKNHRLRRIDLDTFRVTTIAGTGEKRLPENGADAKTSPLFGPRSLAVDDDSIWIALREGNSIWRIDRADKTLHRVAGTGKKGYDGDGGDPLLATFSGPKGIDVDAAGNLLVVDTENHVVRKIDRVANRIETVLGGSDSDSEPIGRLKRPHGIACYRDGFLVGDSENHRVIAAE